MGDKGKKDKGKKEIQKKAKLNQKEKRKAKKDKKNKEWPFSEYSIEYPQPPACKRSIQVVNGVWGPAVRIWEFLPKPAKK